jgi:uncharacterized membrane protein
MNTWEAITGIIILVVSVVLFWQNYNYSTQCNSLGGQISTAITSIFGGTGAQACYNSGIVEVASVITAIIGLVIIYASMNTKSKK